MVFRGEHSVCRGVSQGHPSDIRAVSRTLTRCKVHVRMRCDTAFTGCTVWPMKGKMMTKRETEDRMFVVFGGVFCALLIGCWAALVIALI